ncbi:MAG: hypothetical protein DHS20C21_12420 [Gemmatimonadota bacterium]|nr:MAG: hypothetical protein DHS20C21_12420 [Gemmatimonadota bacterium]
MEVRPRESVILVEDFPAMVAWYRDVLGFPVTKLLEEHFLYANFETPTGIRLGMTPAAQLGVQPADRGNATLALQFEVDDVRAFFAELEKQGATITGPPAYDKNPGFWFGGFADPEGNVFWVVDKNCP